MENEKSKNLSNIKKIEATEIIEATFKEMGKRSLKTIAEHILKENINEENLINDIANVNYTKITRENTPPRNRGFRFVCRRFIYLWISSKGGYRIYSKGWGLLYRGGNGSASYVVEMLRSIVKKTIGKNSNIPHI